MIDAKYVDMTKINVGYDGNKFIDLAEIDIGFSMAEFQKILDERRQTLRAFWIARAIRAKDEWISLKYDINSNQWVKWQAVERKCRQYANKFKD